jgi:hypothetical protein
VVISPCCIRVSKLKKYAWFISWNASKRNKGSFASFTVSLTTDSKSSITSSLCILIFVYFIRSGMALKKTAYFPFLTSALFSMTLSSFIFFKCLFNVAELSLVFSLSSLFWCHCPSDKALRISHFELCSLSWLLMFMFRL